MNDGLLVGVGVGVSYLVCLCCGLVRRSIDRNREAVRALHMELVSLRVCLTSLRVDLASQQETASKPFGCACWPVGFEAFHK